MTDLMLLQIASWRDPITVATVVVAVFTVVSVVVSAFMWNATRQQAWISRQIFEAAHRPYVGVENVDAMIYPGRGGTTLQVDITIKNSGSVPARNVMVTWHVSSSGQEIPRVPHVDRPTVLLPEQSAHVNTSHILSGEIYSALHTSEGRYWRSLPRLIIKASQRRNTTTVNMLYFKQAKALL